MERLGNFRGLWNFVERLPVPSVASPGSAAAFLAWLTGARVGDKDLVLPKLGLYV